MYEKHGSRAPNYFLPSLGMKLLTSSPNFLHKLFSQHFFKNVHLFYGLVLSIFSCIHSLSERSKIFWYIYHMESHYPETFFFTTDSILNLFRVVKVVASKRSKNTVTLLKNAMALKSFRNSSSFYLVSPPSPRPCPHLHGWSWMWASPCSESRERKIEEVQGEGLPFRQVTQNLLLTFPHIQLFTLCLRRVWSAMCPGRRKTWLDKELSILPLPTAVLSRIPSPSHSHCILSSLCKLQHDPILINNLL